MRLPMSLFVSSLAAAALAVVWLVPVSPANAQAQSPSPRPGGAGGMSQPSLPSANISDQKLDQVAAAIKNVANLKENYAQKMAKAQPDQQGKIADEANGAIVKAVTDQGLSVDEYSSILQVAQNDPTVHQKLIDRLRPQGQEQ